VIAQESERLTRIVSDILLANQLDAGRLRLTTQEVDIARLASDVVEEMQATLDGRRDISLELAAPDGSVVVSGDEDRLRQVLLNLVDNAVKYSPDGGRVQVEIEPRESGLRIAVSDEGLGIPHGEQQRIFSKFYRIDPHQTLGVGGTGLGLYICRELVRRMDGRVSVDSREGYGSTFFVDLPLAPLRLAEGHTAEPQPA
jgi:signal transduction histidine kinase